MGLDQRLLNLNKHTLLVTFHLHTKALLLALLLVSLSGQLQADEIRVAVASNFVQAMTAIAEKFEKNTGHKVVLVFGSTGKHYAQIKNGAPFDAFFAADVRRPELLEKEGNIIAGSRFTYAIGKLVLWSPKVGYVDQQAGVLQTDGFRYLAIANPKLAPYGKAAEEVLISKGLWDQFKGRLVRGENIGQTFQFVHSGNAELGFVAFSQIKYPGRRVDGSFWKVPQELYTLIEQQAVLLNDTVAANNFLQFMRSEAILTVLQDYGYQVPEESDAR